MDPNVTILACSIRFSVMVLVYSTAKKNKPSNHAAGDGIERDRLYNSSSPASDWNEWGLMVERGTEQYKRFDVWTLHEELIAYDECNPHVHDCSVNVRCNGGTLIVLGVERWSRHFGEGLTLNPGMSFWLPRGPLLVMLEMNWQWAWNCRQGWDDIYTSTVASGEY